MGRIFQQFPELANLGGPHRPFVLRGPGQGVNVVAQAVFHNLYAPYGRVLLPFPTPDRPMSAEFDDLGHGRDSSAGRRVRHDAPESAAGSAGPLCLAYQSI